MGLVLDNIPGLAEAVAAAEVEEAAIRELPFFCHDTEICGIPVKLFTLRHWMLLKLLKSPFLGYKTELGAVAVCQFIWVVSPSFGGGSDVRDGVFEKVLTVAFSDIVDGINRYIDSSFMDILSKSSGNTDAPVTSFVVSVIHRIATAYGIGTSGLAAFRDEVLDMPLIELSQYRRQILMDSGARFANVISGRVRRQMVANALAESRRTSAKLGEKKTGILSSIANFFR